MIGTPAKPPSVPLLPRVVVKRVSTVNVARSSNPSAPFSSTRTRVGDSIWTRRLSTIAWDGAGVVTAAVREQKAKMRAILYELFCHDENEEPTRNPMNI